MLVPEPSRATLTVDALRFAEQVDMLVIVGRVTPMVEYCKEHI